MITHPAPRRAEPMCFWVYVCDDWIHGWAPAYEAEFKKEAL